MAKSGTYVMQTILRHHHGKLKVAAIKTQTGINFKIHITWTQDKVKVTILKKLPKIQILEFKKNLNMRQTFWSWLIRCVNMKWIWLVLWKIQSGHDSVHRRTDGQGETSITSGYNKNIIYSIRELINISARISLLPDSIKPILDDHILFLLTTKLHALTWATFPLGLLGVWVDTVIGVVVHVVTSRGPLKDVGESSTECRWCGAGGALRGWLLREEMEWRLCARWTAAREGLSRPNVAAVEGGLGTASGELSVLLPPGLTVPKMGSMALKEEHMGEHRDGLAQDCSNSSVHALELLQFCAKPSIAMRYILV